VRPDRVASFGCRRLDDELLPWRPASSSRILILTTFDLDAYVYEAPCAGASGFLLKDAPPADLLPTRAAWLDRRTGSLNLRDSLGPGSARYSFGSSLSDAELMQ